MARINADLPSIWARQQNVGYFGPCVLNCLIFSVAGPVKQKIQAWSSQHPQRPKHVTVFYVLWTHILQCCANGIDTISLPHCQWNNPERHGIMNHKVHLPWVVVVQRRPQPVMSVILGRFVKRIRFRLLAQVTQEFVTHLARADLEGVHRTRAPLNYLKYIFWYNIVKELKIYNIVVKKSYFKYIAFEIYSL